MTFKWREKATLIHIIQRNQAFILKEKNKLLTLTIRNPFILKKTMCIKVSRVEDALIV